MSIQLSAAQTASNNFLFGSIDDPFEQNNESWWQTTNSFEVRGGFSLIGPQWHSALGGMMDVRNKNTSLRLSTLIRTGVYGTYDEDTNELKDLLRAIEFVRYRPNRGNRYLRIGPLTRTRLGSGHLVNFFSTEAARDSRTVGAEARAAGSHTTIEAFAEDLTAPGLVGARISFQPMAAARGIASTLSISASAVSDRSKLFDGQEIAIEMEALRTGGFSYHPFISGARIPSYGQGLLFGADVRNDNFIDLARLHFRLALHYNSSDFRPGYFGSFYTVSSHRAQILGNSQGDIAGLGLREIKRGNSINTELRLMFFERFELWYAFMRYHGVQTLSEYHLRLYMNGPAFRVMIGQDRAGLTGFASLFGELGSENRMHFSFEYHVLKSFWITAHAYYTYIEIEESTSSTPQFLVQRRFSPLISLRRTW